MSHPLISILLPTYSRAKDGYLERTIKSILAQTYKNWELVIVDDGSQDGSGQLIERYCKLDKRIRHLRLPANVGLTGKTLARGYLETTGQYLACAFDDTVLYPNHLLLLLDELLCFPHTGFVYAQCRLMPAKRA